MDTELHWQIEREALVGYCWWDRGGLRLSVGRVLLFNLDDVMREYGMQGSEEPMQFMSGDRWD